MLYVYDKNKKALVPCKETQFKDHGILERQDLEKWIETNPAILGEDLLIVTSEYDRFDKTNERLDLLAIDRDGNLAQLSVSLTWLPCTCCIRDREGRSSPPSRPRRRLRISSKTTTSRGSMA